MHAANLQILLLLVPQMTRPFSELLKPLTFKMARNVMHVSYKFHFHYRNSVALSGMHAYVCLFLFL